jgi:hypothetical protein
MMDGMCDRMDVWNETCVCVEELSLLPLCTTSNTCPRGLLSFDLLARSQGKTWTRRPKVVRSQALRDREASDLFPTYPMCFDAYISLLNALVFLRCSSFRTVSQTAILVRCLNRIDSEEKSALAPPPRAYLPAGPSDGCHLNRSSCKPSTYHTRGIIARCASTLLLYENRLVGSCVRDKAVFPLHIFRLRSSHW